MCRSVIDGANSVESTRVSVQCSRVVDLTCDHVIGCSAIIVGTPINFGYMSGLMKDFFERIYYDCLDITVGKPYGVFVKGDTDVDGGLSSIYKIITGLAWKEVAEPVCHVGRVDSEVTRACFELGASVCAGLDFDLY